IDLLHVPYKSVPQGLNDVLAGRVSLILTDLMPGLPHVRAGTLRALAVTRLKRSALVPDVPSLHEAGVTNFDMDSWAGLFAPAGTPPDVVGPLDAEVRKDPGEPQAQARSP